MNVLVVAVHPDDETLGCGGTLLKHRDAGDEVHWVIVTEASAPELLSRRNQQISDVAQAYGFHKVHRLGFATTRLDVLPMSDLVGALSAVFRECQPAVVYLPFAGDAHSDHRIAFEVAFSCTKVFRYPSVRRVLMMETPSETDFAAAGVGTAFVPNVFVDISRQFEAKLHIARIYQDELANHPFPRSEEGLRALATVRGAAAGAQYAESFMLVKEIS